MSPPWWAVHSEARYSLARWLPFTVDAVTYAVSWFTVGRIRTDLSAPEEVGPRQPARR